MGAASAMTDGEVCEFIRATFACPPDVAAAIFARGAVRRFPPQSVILRQGEAASSAFLLSWGSARALLYTVEGQMILVCDYRAGDLFGAVGEIDPAPEEAEVVAAEASGAFALRALELVALAETHGSIGLALSRLLLKQLRRANSRVYERAAISAVGRVCAELLRVARERDGLAIRPSPVLSELAVRVSTTRETASRAVSMLERRGIVRRDASSLVVVAPQRLEELIV